MKLLTDLLLLADTDWTHEKDVHILSAVDALLYPSFLPETHGLVAAVLTAMPGLCVKLCDTVRAGDQSRARELHTILLRMRNAIFADNSPANVKAAMRFRGRDGGFPRAPMPESSIQPSKTIYDALSMVREDRLVWRARCGLGALGCKRVCRSCMSLSCVKISESLEAAAATGMSQLP